MSLVRFLIAGSVLALGAATADAQTSTNTSNVSQTGTGNLLEIENARAGNDFNRSDLIQNGRNNTTTVLQVGDFNASQARQIGDRNRITHSEEGDFNRAESFQNGNDNRSAIRQRGQSNSGTVNQEGNRNLSLIAQGVEAGSSTDFDTTTFFQTQNATTRTGSDNRVQVSQVGDDLASTVRQRAASGSSAAAGNNIANVQQRGLGSDSVIVQESRGNSATVYQFEGGSTAGSRNRTSIVQNTPTATSTNNPLSNNRADVSVRGQANSSTVRQSGTNNSALVTQGLGTLLVADITQTGTGTGNRVAVGQSGISNSILIAQSSPSARATVWQQAGPSTNRSSNNSAEIQQGTGTTGSAAFSAAFFGNSAPVSGDQTRNLSANVTQGNNPGTAVWNVAQVRQDGVDLAAVVQQAGSGTAQLPNIVRIGQQGGSTGANSATAIQRAGVGPSAPGDVGSGQSGDEFFFAGGARSAEITILQGGSSNSATVEQRGRGQLARVEQGPGSGNLATILQDVGATNATAVIRQSGSNNSYDVVQTGQGQYIVVSQTGNGNAVTNIVQRP